LKQKDEIEIDIQVIESYEKKLKLYVLIPTSINRIQRWQMKGTKASQALSDKSRASRSEHLE